METTIQLFGQLAENVRKETKMSPVESKLFLLLDQAKRFLSQIKADPESLEQLTLVNFAALRKMAEEFGKLIEFRLKGENSMITHFEKTLEEIMSGVDPFSGEDPLHDSAHKLLLILRAIKTSLNNEGV